MSFVNYKKQQAQQCNVESTTIVSKNNFWHKHKYIILLFLAIILVRIPALILWNPYITGSDAAIYMETAKNVAKGNGYVSSFCRFSMDKEKLINYVEKYGPRFEGQNRAPLYIYLLAGIYLITDDAGFMDGVNILNLLFFIAALILFYLFLLKTYPNNTFVHFASILWLGFSFPLFKFSYGAWLENYTLFLFVLVLLYHYYLVKKDTSSLGHIVLYSFVLALLFVTKRSVIPIVGAFILHFLLLKKYKQFFQISVLFIIFAGGWYLIRETCYNIPDLYPFSHNYPFGETGYKESIIPRFYFFSTQVLRALDSFLSVLIDFENLSVLLPFSIIYLCVYKKGLNKQIIWLLLSVTAFVYIFGRGATSTRNYYPVFVPLIPASFLALDDLLKHLNKNKRILSIYFILALPLFFSLKNMADFTKNVVISGEDRKRIFLASDKLLDQICVPENAIITSNVVGYNVYSKRNCVLTPPNIDHGNKYEFIDLFNIDYVIHCNGFSKYFFWNEYSTNWNSFLDYEQVGKSDFDDRIILYKVIPKESIATKIK